MKRSVESERFPGREPMFGPTLRAFRNRAEWSLDRLAEATFYSRSHLGNVERGIKAPTLALARACDEALRCGTILQNLVADQHPLTDVIAAVTSGRQLMSRRLMQLPASITPFVGRAQHLAELDRLTDTTAVVAVYGESGVGKTQLVLRWAHHVAAEYRDGVLWADLHGDGPARTHASPSALLGAWLRAFGVAGEDIAIGLDARAAQWRSLLAERQVLVVLDNAASTSQVRPLLLSGTASRTLVTSGERLADLAIRDGARHLHLPSLTEQEAVALITVVLGQDTVAREPEAAATLADRAHWLPHRLRLITEYALAHPALSLTDLASRPDSTQPELAATATEGRTGRWRRRPWEVDMQEHVNAGLVYNYYLGGAANFAADRGFARRSAEIIPEVALLAQVNRYFLGRAVKYCVEQGVDQFMDIGAAYVPAVPMHEIVQAHNPDATLVYVDNEPVAVQAIQQDVAMLDSVGVVLADLRDPAGVLHNPVTDRLIDFSRPLGLIMGLMLHFVPDEDGLAEILAEYRTHIAPDSYLIISHDTADGREDDMRRFAEHYGVAKQPLILRDHAELTQLASGFTLVPPGIVHMPLWRPDPADPPVDQPERSCVYAMVLRVPG